MTNLGDWFLTSCKIISRNYLIRKLSLLVQDHDTGVPSENGTQYIHLLAKIGKYFWFEVKAKSQLKLNFRELLNFK